MAEVLYSCILFIHSDIFSTYCSWRYESIQDRLDIGVGVLNIFNMILGDLTWISENESSANLGHVRNYLITSFLDSKRSYDINSLLDVLAIGNDLSAGFYTRNQFKEANSVELMIVGALELLEKLVSIRVSSKRQISFLETAIIDHSVDSSLSSRLGSENIEIIQIIGLYMRYDLNIQIPQKSADILKMMAVVLQESGVSSSSFVGYFGDDAKSIVSSMLYLLKEELLEQNSGLQSSIYACVSVILSAQPGLASVFLNNERKVMGDSFDGTINTVILNGLKKWEKMLKMDIKTFSLMLKVLVVLFHNISQYRKTVAKWIETETLWDVISAIVESRLTGDSNENDMTKCYWDFVKGHIMHIIALTIHSTKTVESAGISVSAKVYEIARKILTHSINGSIQPCFDGLDAPYSPELEVWVHCQFSTMKFAFDLYSLRIPSWNDEIGRIHGEGYLFDPFLFQFKCGNNTDDSLFNGIRQINISLSRMDAFLYKIKGWKGLIEIITVSSLDKVWRKDNPLAHDGSEYLVEILESVLDRFKSESREGFAMDILRQDLSELIFFISGQIVKNSVLPTAFLQKIVSLLVPIQECMRVDFLKLGPIGQFSAYNFQIILMASSLLVLRAYDCSMRKIKKGKTEEIEKSVKEGLQIVFPVVITGLSFIINGILAQIAVNNEDLSLLLTFFTEIVRTNASLSPESWIPILDQSRLIENLGTIFSQSLLIPSIPLTIAEQILELFLALSKDPLVVELLAVNGIVSYFSNNCFSETIVEGKMDSYCNYEQNPSHKIWCLMLSIISNMLLHLGHSSQFIEEVYGFIKLYQNQILRSLKLSPLTYGNVSEVLRVSEMFYGLARAKKGLTESDVLCGYQDFGLRLLGEVSFLFRSPNEFQKTAKVVSLQEKALLDVDEPENRTLAKSRFFLNVELQLVYLCRNLMAHFRSTTRADEMLNMSISATHTSQNIFQMTMQSHGIQGCSIGSLFDIFRYLSSLLLKRLENNSQQQVLAAESTLSFTMESCLAVIVTQIAVWSSMGELDISLVRELRNELNQSLQDLSNIYKMADNQVSVEIWDVKKSIEFIGTIISFCGSF